MFAAENEALQRHVEEQTSLRGVRVVSGGDVLRRCASLLRRPPCAETFAASRPDEEVDYFVSHSQQTGWTQKAWALLYTLNVVPAVVVAILSDAVANLAACLLRSGGVQLGLSTYFWFSADVVVDVLPGMPFVGCAVFVAYILLGHHAPGLSRKSFFIDKCCVAQDAESQLMALRQLRPTLLSSKRMILLWQPEYFDSLACVHELATFLHAHRGSGQVRRVSVVPVCMPLLTAVLFVFHATATAVIMVLHPLLVCSEWHMDWVDAHVPEGARYAYLVAVHFVMMFFGLYLVPSFFLWRFANAYMDGRRKLREQLATFCVERSKCFLEAHRQALLADIADRFGSVQEFERFIRTELPPVISVLRQAPVPLMTAIVGAISHFFFFTAIIASAIQQGKADVAARGAITLPIVWLCTDSLALNLVLVLAGRVLASERPPPPTTDRSYSGRRHASWRHALPHYPGRLGSVLRSRIVRSLLGPLTSATVFAGLCAIGISVFFPVLPTWGACLVLLGVLAMVALLYNFDYAPRSSASCGEASPRAVGGRRPSCGGPPAVAGVASAGGVAGAGLAPRASLTESGGVARAGLAPPASLAESPAELSI